MNTCNSKWNTSQKPGNRWHLQVVLMQRDAEIHHMHSQAQPKTTESTSPIGMSVVYDVQ